MTTNNGRTIPVHKAGDEGILTVDAMTGTITTPAGERPIWAEGLAVAMLAERVGFYERALGALAAESLRMPEVFEYADLSWVGVDEEGDEVEVEASHSYRSEQLAMHLGIDTSEAGWDASLPGAVAEAEVAHTYQTHPTDERTLAEAEGITFGQVEKQASNG